MITPTLPDNLPVPEDDGAAAHLPGARVPHMHCQSTAGYDIDLGRLPALAVVFRVATHRPAEVEPLVAHWDDVRAPAAARLHHAGLSRLHCGVRAAGASVFGLSTQDTGIKATMVERRGVPFPILSAQNSHSPTRCASR